MENPVTITARADGTFVLDGDLSWHNAADFEALVATLVPTGVDMTLDLSGLDLVDGFSIAIAINAVRELQRHADKVILIAAPQILCHNLYRVGMLESNDRLELIAMREDEPYG